VFGKVLYFGPIYKSFLIQIHRGNHGEWMDGWTDGRMDRHMDVWTDRWTDGWMDGFTFQEYACLPNVVPSQSLSLNFIFVFSFILNFIFILSFIFSFLFIFVSFDFHFICTSYYLISCHCILFHFISHHFISF